jgi:hypothetical protein
MECPQDKQISPPNYGGGCTKTTTNKLRCLSPENERNDSMRNRLHHIQLGRRAALGAVAVCLLGFALNLAKAQSAPPAAAGPTQTATGTSTFEETDTLLHIADGNAYFAFTAVLELVGDLTGTAMDSGHFVAHSDGSITFEGTEVGTGTFLGIAGGWSGNFWGRISPSGEVSGGNSYSGTGGLTGLHLTGCLGVSPGPNTYCFGYHFDSRK